MKVIIATAGAENAARWRVEILPDSAILRDGKPLFLPSLTAAPSFSAALAFRVGRLGKNIGRKFADRYFDALTLCVKMAPAADEVAFSAADLARFADSAIVVGDWVELEGFDAPTSSASVLSTRLAVERSLQRSLDLIADVTRYATIKMGDIVVVDPAEILPGLEIDDIVTGSLNNRQLLRFRIK
ncbi:MAG: hypothetical protein IK053_02370 [Muribaculaceae bacterium]|nr:hypothetical protein [Muribaculaceae bacterium]